MYIERQSFSSLVNSEYKSNFGVVPISQKKSCKLATVIKILTSYEWKIPGFPQLGKPQWPQKFSGLLIFCARIAKTVISSGTTKKILKVSRQAGSTKINLRKLV